MNGFAEAREAMRSAAIMIEQYQRKDAEHERLIATLYELLGKDDLDTAYYLVKDAYRAIHGPRE